MDTYACMCTLYSAHVSFMYISWVADEAVKRYNQGNREWGFGQLIPLSTFRNPNQGFIVQNTVSFGAEIFIIRPVGQQERVSFVSNPPDNVFTWRILRFSSLEDKIYYSSEFLVGDRFWLVLYLMIHIAPRKS